LPQRPRPENQESGFDAAVSSRADVGFSHIALGVGDIDRSLDFYARYASFDLVHRRNEGTDVAWLSDLRRPFVLVLIQLEKIETRLGGICHLGVGCSSREEVDRLCDLARSEDCLQLGPVDSGYPVGYWAFLRDPDGHHLEISYGQEVALTISEVRRERG